MSFGQHQDTMLTKRHAGSGNEIVSNSDLVRSCGNIVFCLKVVGNLMSWREGLQSSAFYTKAGQELNRNVMIP